MTSLQFDNLPLVEAAVRVSLGASLQLSFAAIYDVHDGLRQEFPSISEAEQVEVAPGLAESETRFGIGIVPGAVFCGHSAGITVTLQPQVIIARWFRKSSLSDSPYPRYGALRDALWRTVDLLRKHGDDTPPVAVVNMSYVNFIPSNRPDIVREYFSEVAQIKVLDGAKVLRKLEAGWKLASDVDVRFCLEQTAAKMPDGITAGYRLTTAAGIKLGPTQAAKESLELVHDTLQGLFRDLISSRARDEWQLREVPG